MLGPRTRPCRVFIVLLLLSNVFLISMYGARVYGDDAECPPHCPNTNLVDVSPGKDDLKLGAGFPTFGPVKLSYPNSSILTNSTGDLLFSVTLNPLMLNHTSAQVGSQVLVWGSGFAAGDTSCTLSGTPVASPSCSILGGILTPGSFTVADVLAGTYTITATGNPEGDFSSTTFTVLPPTLVLNPSSGPDGVTVSVSGFGFYSTDGPCVLTGDPISAVPAQTCTIGGGVLTGSFSVAGPAGTYPITVTITGADDTGEAVASFRVTDSSQVITLSPSSGLVGTVVGVSGSGFSSTDTTCSLSGRIIAAPSSCSIALGIVALGLSFTVGNVAPDVYTITAIGSPGGDLATADFQVLPSAPSVPISASVSLDIYIPPDFSGLALSNVWTSFTNNHDPHSITLSRVSGSDRIGPNWWKVSVNDITVTHSPSSYSIPLVAHRIFLFNQTQYVRLFQVTSPSIAGRYFFKIFINGASVGAQNFPTLVVKASRDPAYISGTLRDFGSRNSTNAGQPIDLPEGYGARVLATGIDYLGRPVSAQAFINSTAEGQYTLFGVAPGSYNLTVYAAGYIPTTWPFIVSVVAAQSLEHVDIYMIKSAIVTGTVLSEDAAGGLIPWGNLLQVSPNGFSRPTNRSISIKILNLDGSVVASTPAPYGITLFTNSHSTTFEFSIRRELGFDGRIPQNFANYTSGLSSGDYMLRAYVTSYVQFEDVRIHVNNDTTDSGSVIPLVRTGIISVTVHFKLFNSTIAAEPLPVGATLTVSAYDDLGILRAQNVTFVPAKATEATVELQGFSNARSFGISSLFSQNGGLLPGTYHIVARLTSSPSFAGFANVGIRDLYYQTQDIQVSIGLGDGVVSISLVMYKAGGILLTVHSINYQIPPVPEFWAYPGTTIKVTIIDSNGVLYQANTTQPAHSADVTFTYIGLQTSRYDVFIQTLGYTQTEILHVIVVMGGNSDAPVWMIRNPVIDLTVFFREEGILANISSTLPFAQPINHIDATPACVEVYDYLGNFVAANATYVRNNSTQAEFMLAGFDLYYGDPRFIWSGFYDTTDAASQTPGGLILYPWDNSPREYTVRVWVDGYYQLEQLRVTVPARGNVSVAEPVDRATRIHGTVIGPDFFDIARPLSWATITLEPDNYTLTRIIDVRPGNYTTSSLDGSFQVWVPPGSYGMGVGLAGYATYSTKIRVPSGSDLSMDVWLDNYLPFPEWVIAPVGLLTVTLTVSRSKSSWAA